jgi:hypothetical protein
MFMPEQRNTGESYSLWYTKKACSIRVFGGNVTRASVIEWAGRLVFDFLVTPWLWVEVVCARMDLDQVFKILPKWQSSTSPTDFSNVD